jgi:serine/threonine protein kinase
VLFRSILLTRDGNPMLSDFGIAKIMDENKSNSVTATNVGVGTPEYMAPEQWVNKASPRSDIYALGIIYYEMVTGARPYASDTPAGVAIKQATEPIPDPRRFILELPDQVVLTILKALARRPEDRYENMGLFAIALEKLAMDDIHPPQSASEEKNVDTNPPQLLPYADSGAVDPAKTASNSKIMRQTDTGWSGWVAMHLFLSLLLGGLMVAAALMRVQGVVTAPISLFPANPSQSGTTLPAALPGINPMDQVLNPIATAINSIMADPTRFSPTITPTVRATAPKNSSAPTAQLLTPSPTSPYDVLPSIPTVNK